MMAEVQAPVEKWRMPVPISGQVKWRHHDRSNGRWYTAIVTRNDGQTINLVVLPDGERGTLIAQEGSRHVDDPSLAKMVGTNPGGVWDLCDTDKLILDLRARVEKLESDLFGK